MKHLSTAVAITALFGFSGLTGCAMDAGSDSSKAGFEEAPAGMLPAWKLPGDYKVPGKADQYDDYRAAHPEWYAITEAPKKSGFHLFREWEPMKGVMLAFPGSQGTNINWSISEMVVQGYEAVHWYVLHDGNSNKTFFNNLLTDKGMSQSAIDNNVTFLNFDLDSIWTIDFGPFSILDTNNTVAFVDMRYYHQRIDDDAIPTKFGDWIGVTTYRMEMSMEGGNLQSDENGTCYFTQGLYWENGDKSANELHQLLKDYVGCETFVAIQPLQDGTSHMDMFSKLASKNHFVLGKCTTANCSSTTVNTLNNDADILSAAVLADGSKLTLHRIPMPYQKDGKWRTYTNSTLANNINLWPVYDVSDSDEAEAAVVWQQAMPGWQHIGISSNTIIGSGGAMHCVSRNLPAGTYSEWEPDGPEWICPYNDCGGAQDCGDLTYEGCCDGDLLKWCENNAVQSQNCANNPSCGWSAPQGFYNCNTNGGEDPSGQHPKNCDGGCEPACAGKECGDDGCGGSCGQCPAGEACNASGQCAGCTPSCVGKECGADGCGGSCGQCPAGEACNASGQCVGQTDPCNGIGYEGCCDGLVLTWCENGTIQTIDCGENEPRYAICGWSDEAGYYDCGQTGADPSGQFPLACGGCQADCAGKECGADGCGGSCGTCGAGESCMGYQCVGCTPDCTSKQCGDDGCGGSCGACQAGQTCTTTGQCVGETDPCLGLGFDGCCDGTEIKWCENGQISSMDCGGNGCGWNPQNSFYDCGFTEADPSGQFPIECPKPCEADCAGKQCGGDGCGGSCGACPAGEQCLDFQCVGCQPDCAGKACGDDGCGGSCGACAAGEKCENFQCVGCQPDCAGKACGDDGCGGSCGDCPPATPFCVYGVCVEDCNPDCTGKQCGDNGCGGSCGNCGAGQQCVNGVCQQQTFPDTSGQDAVCTPDCIGKTCGANGCGGTCGTCPVGFACSLAGQCMVQPVGDSGSGDVTTDVAGADESGKSGGSCSAGGTTEFPTGLGFLLLGLFAAMVARRFRHEA